jgi:uncharacterized membrane protein
MNTLCKRVAGRSVERLAAFSDDIFAVAMTLLGIDFHLPAAEAIRSERDLFHALLDFRGSRALHQAGQYPTRS